MKVGETDDRLLKQKQTAAANEGMLRKQTMAAQKGNDMVDQQEIDGIVKEIYEDMEEMHASISGQASHPCQSDV